MKFKKYALIVVRVLLFFSILTSMVLGFIWIEKTSPFVMAIIITALTAVFIYLATKE